MASATSNPGPARPVSTLTSIHEMISSGSTLNPDHDNTFVFLNLDDVEAHRGCDCLNFALIRHAPDLRYISGEIRKVEAYFENPFAGDQRIFKFRDWESAVKVGRALEGKSMMVRGRSTCGAFMLISSAEILVRVQTTATQTTPGFIQLPPLNTQFFPGPEVTAFITPPIRTSSSPNHALGHTSPTHRPVLPRTGSNSAPQRASPPPYEPLDPPQPPTARPILVRPRSASTPRELRARSATTASEAEPRQYRLALEDSLYTLEIQSRSQASSSNPSNAQDSAQMAANPRDSRREAREIRNNPSSSWFRTEWARQDLNDRGALPPTPTSPEVAMSIVRATESPAPSEAPTQGSGIAGSVSSLSRVIPGLGRHHRRVGSGDNRPTSMIVPSTSTVASADAGLSVGEFREQISRMYFKLKAEDQAKLAGWMKGLWEP